MKRSLSENCSVQICPWAILLFMGLFFILPACEEERATLSEGHETIKTYPFGDPSPIPIFADHTNQRGNINIYPYFSFNEYSHTGIDKEWNVIRLENDYIEVSILPEVGGKIWGAIEKSTGKDFIYLNQVKKFRNIALRGPWTSGGIEFNFGVTGHTPTTSTPVDYITRENADGSVSTIIGALDLPSRTEWRVTITLPKDKAWFETESFWYNPTPLKQSNYVWMNAAVEATDDLQFFFPGQYHIGHSGDAHPWPVDEEGRDLSWYRNNDFGGSKSYHVLGEKTEYFGGYWHDDNVGFGNWSLYNDMPGKKLWIWSLSRAGSIWEDLLTDSDGQYVEVQSGRLFSQAIGRSVETPFNYDLLDPLITDRWTELWFPVKDTDGISAASPYGVLNVDESGQQTVVKLMALQSINDNLQVTLGNDVIYNTQVSLDPMELFEETLDISGQSENLKIVLGDQKLVYNSQTDLESFDRPIENRLETEELTSAQHYRLARNEIGNRNHTGGYDHYYASLEKDPAFTPSHVGLANLYVRRGEYEKALEMARMALSQNTYDPDANQIYGVIKARTGDTVQALEAFGWAARSNRYRSGAYASMAELYLKTGRFERAIEFANRSLDFNRYNITALKAKAISYRKQQNLSEARSVLDKISDLDPLNHFANFERYLLEENQNSLDDFNRLIRNELPHETYLELAIYYHNIGLDREAVGVLKQAPSQPMINYWLAYLQKDYSAGESSDYLDRAVAESPYLVFPFRPESIPVLKWAEEQNSSWKNSYYLGLVYFNAGRNSDAIQLFDQIGNESDYAPFYLVRGTLRDELDRATEDVYSDLTRAVDLDPEEWRTWHYLNDHYANLRNWENSLDISEGAFEKFPETDAIAIDYARALLHNQQYEACVNHLTQINLLPFYQAGESRTLFEQANIFHATELINDGQMQEALNYLENAKTWPENLAVGEPFDPDIRLTNFLKAAVHQQLDNQSRANELFNDVIAYTEAFPNRRGAGQYAAVLALRMNGQNTQAQQLMDEWQNAQPDHLTTRWAVAHFNQNMQMTRQLEQQNRDNLSLQLFAESIQSATGLTGN